ncbi:MAG: type II/IV secretion system protein [Candidatus Paceibacterota bacterium]|jgi:type IV pilus assembly protein PilB
MSLPNAELKKLMVSDAKVPEADFDTIVEKSKQTNESVGALLIKDGLVKEEKFAKIMSAYYGVPFADLKEETVKSEFLELLPEVVARIQEAVVFDGDVDNVKLATSNPNNIEFINHVEKITEGRVHVFYATPLGIEEGLKAYKNNIYKEVKDLIEDYKVNANENSIVLLVNAFLDYAYENVVSDIHIEPTAEGYVSVRFRIDGVLYETVRYPFSLHRQVVTRIKIMSHLRTDEQEATQDGRLEYKREKDSFDVRVSILPVTNGENIVMRILSEKAKKIALEELGLLGHDLAKVQKAIDKPYGMVVVVGPTGSGKTTTLYSIIQILNKQPINIVTIEDPVEYSIERVQQIHVNVKKNITFANGLRSIVRQDPDVIMVGEIRDNETASIAVNAAMTGHMLLSTLHANDAATVFPRFLEMGIEPFLIASSVNVVVAQRLVRKICPHCKINYPPHPEALDEFKKLATDKRFTQLLHEYFKDEKIKDIKLYKGSGCKQCNHTGYLGRIGVFEVMEISDNIKNLIIKKASAAEIEAKAVDEGMSLMYYNGLSLVVKGETTLEEVSDLTNK